MSDYKENILSALELGNEAYCFISTATLCQALNAVEDFQQRIAKLEAKEAKLQGVVECRDAIEYCLDHVQSYDYHFESQYNPIELKKALAAIEALEATE